MSPERGPNDEGENYEGADRGFLSVSQRLREVPILHD